MFCQLSGKIRYRCISIIVKITEPFRNGSHTNLMRLDCTKPSVQLAHKTVYHWVLSARSIKMHTHWPENFHWKCLLILSREFNSVKGNLNIISCLLNKRVLYYIKRLNLLVEGKCGVWIGAFENSFPDNEHNPINIIIR